jgi:hypothetical protein
VEHYRAIQREEGHHLEVKEEAEEDGGRVGWIRREVLQLGNQAQEERDV